MLARSPPACLRRCWISGELTAIKKVPTGWGTNWMGDLCVWGGQLFDHGLGHEKAVCCVWWAIGFGYRF